jgi:pimeloyl-ACP methyl ester carboxylesterase
MLRPPPLRADLAGALLGRPAPRPVGDVAGFAPPAGPPALATRALEVRAVLQVARLLRAAPWLAGAPRGSGTVVVDLPGWRAPEASGAPLRAYLRALGYDARPWGLGTNGGAPARDAERLAERLAATHGDAPVALVGWSLGGVVAREIARAEPDRVSHVVTYGTPVVGGPTYTFAATAYGERASRRAAQLAARLDADRPIRVPITAIFTRRDGVVDWRACIDRTSPHVRHVEVGSTHLGLGLDPDVWWTVAQALAGR